MWAERRRILSAGVLQDVGRCRLLQVSADDSAALRFSAPSHACRSADIFKEIDILIALKHDNVVFMKGGWAWRMGGTRKDGQQRVLGKPSPTREAVHFSLVRGARPANMTRVVHALCFTAEYFEENNKVYLIMEMLSGERPICTSAPRLHSLQAGAPVAARRADSGSVQDARYSHFMCPPLP